MTEVRASLGIKKGSPRDWTLHDLRRTFATGLQKLGVAPHVVTHALGQTPPRAAGVADVTMTYALHDFFDERRAALESWARHVEAIASGMKGASVVPIRRGWKR
jgi:hypothetical protein